MLLYNGSTNPNTIDYQQLSSYVEYLRHLSGENLFTTMSGHKNGNFTFPSVMTSEFLDAKIQYNSLLYHFMYLPSPEIAAALLYPITICRWHALSTHFTKRSNFQFYQLIYTHAGSGIMNFDSQIYHLAPDSLFLLDCRSYHYFYSNDESGWEYSFIHFDGNATAYFYKEIRKKELLFPNLKGTEIQRIYNDIISLANNNPENFDIYFHQQLTNLLITLISSKAERPKMTLPEWLSNIHAYILECYNQPWSVHDLALRSNLSDSRFAHIFTKFLGSSPIEYRDNLRMEHAKEYLSNTDLSVEQISELVGYSTLSAFYAKFEKKVGIAPGKYRKQCKSPK